MIRHLLDNFVQYLYIKQITKQTASSVVTVSDAIVAESPYRNTKIGFGCKL